MSAGAALAALVGMFVVGIFGPHEPLQGVGALSQFVCRDCQPVGGVPEIAGDDGKPNCCADSGDGGLPVRGVGRAIGGINRLFAVAHGTAQIGNLSDKNGHLSKGGDYGYNAYSDRPSLVDIVALYVVGMVGGPLLGCIGALHLNNDRKRVGAALICGALSLCAASSIAFVIGLGVS